MLGKQWLNRYASDMRGSAIERSQNRQRKLDGIVTWYFDHVMELLPLMLQFALLLLGCALSRYLWDVETTVALVVLGVTSFGVTSYAFFVVAGAASDSCPYQTPGAHILRHILPLALSGLRSASSNSELIDGVANWWHMGIKNFECSISHIVKTALLPILILVGLAVDAYFLARAMVRVFLAYALVVRGWLHRVRGWDPHTAALDLQCISWILQTSLDKTIHLSTLRLLGMMATLANFEPALAPACFNILASCVSITGDKVAILQGSEELVAISAMCCLRILSHVTAMGPASSVFKDMRRRYTKTFPIETDFEGLPSYHHLCIIHNVFYPSHKQVRPPDLSVQDFYRPKIQWKDYKLSNADHAILVQLAQFEYQRKQYRKVPRWILRFIFHLLSQDSLPSVSVVTGCLAIVVMDLGRTVLNTATLDARYAHIGQLFTFLTENQRTAGRSFKSDNWRA